MNEEVQALADVSTSRPTRNVEGTLYGPSFTYTVVEQTIKTTTTGTATNANLVQSVSFDGTGNSRSATIKIKVPQAAYYHVKIGFYASFYDDARNSWVNTSPATVDIDGTAVSVGIAPVANAPLAAGVLCLNAQSDYQKAKWKATVLPEGTNAKLCLGTVGVVADDIQFPAQVQNNQVFDVTGSRKTGMYKIMIAHALHEHCSAMSSQGNVFKFVIKKINDLPATPGQAAGDNGPTGGGGRHQASKYADSDHLGDIWAATQPRGWSAGNPASGVDDINVSYGAKLESNYDFYITAEPTTCYSGKVSCSDGNVSQRVKDVVTQSSSMGLEVCDETPVWATRMKGAWEYAIPGTPAKISYDANFVEGKSCAAAFNHGVSVTVPGFGRAFSQEQQPVTLTQSNIPFGYPSTRKSVDLTANVGWISTAIFQANDPTSKGSAWHGMVGSAIRGDTDTSGECEVKLADTILDITGTHFEIKP